MYERNDERLIEAGGGVSAFGEAWGTEGVEELSDRFSTSEGPIELHFYSTGRCRLEAASGQPALKHFLELMIETWNRGVRDGRSDPYAPIESLVRTEPSLTEELRAELVCAFLQSAASALAVCRDAPQSELAALEHRVHRVCRLDLPTRPEHSQD